MWEIKSGSSYPRNKRTVKYSPSPPYAASDKYWSDLVHSHYFKRLQSAQIQHYVLLHNATPAWNALIRCSAACRLSSHLPAHHCHIPAQYNRANLHLLPNQHWRKGQRPSQQTESNDRDESPPIPPLAEWKSQDGRRSPNQLRHLSGGLLPPPTQCAQSKCQGPGPGRKAEVRGRLVWRGPDRGPPLSAPSWRTPSSLSVAFSLSAACYIEAGASG